MKNNCKHGLFKYDTENIGDEIQSIAASRFLPSVDYYFDRDDIDATKISPNERVKLIMNGWFTHKPENWPPKNEVLDPLLVSMHIEEDALDGTAAASFLKLESLSFLKNNGPVGARDLCTLEFLKVNNIDAYFSGCVTLTLLPAPGVKKQNFALAVDVLDSVTKKMERDSNVPVISIDTVRSLDVPFDSKLLLAKYWLYLYQSAQYVVTTRLHTMLPCLALGTPVLGLSNADPKRYSGLIDLVNNMSVDEYVGSDFVFNESSKNPTTYLEYKKKLEFTCSEFTDFDSEKSYLDGLNVDSLLTDVDFITLVNQIALISRKKDLLEYQIELMSLEAVKAQSEAPSPGIKESTRLLIKALKRRISKL